MVKLCQPLKVKITAGNAGQTFIVHGPEDQIGSDYRYPKMNEAKCIVQIAAKHFREPVIYAGKHSKE